MLPASFQTPAAIVLLAGGLISCFAGYRVFRIVLGIYGFILGALVASSAMGTEHTVWMIVAALSGGIVGGLALRGNHLAVDAAAHNNVWLAYPMDPAPGQHWVLVTWLALGVIGAGVQLGITAHGKT